MRIILLSLMLLSGLAIFGQTAIEIRNPSSFARNEEVIEIPWSQISENYPALDTANFKVINSITKKELEYQLEYKGTSQIQNLLVMVNTPANGKISLKLVKGKHIPFVSKTYCRFVPERKEDFAWENDKIAFRMYGRALEKTPNEMAYGTDVWVKRTKRLVLNERYKRGEYHIDHGDGMDYYHVGFTLGAGDIAPFIHDTIWYPRNYVQWKVLDNGPLRSTFQLSYDEWIVSGRKVKCTKTISLDAGSQLNKVMVSYETSGSDPLPVVTGIIKRKEPGEMLLNEKAGIMAYWEPQHGVDGTTGIACISTASLVQMMVEQGQLLTATLLKSPYTIEYYNGAAWDKAGKITSAREWFDYLNMFKKKMQQPLIINIHKS